MDIVEEYRDKLSKIVGQEVFFEYFLDFANIHPSEWRKFTINDISRSKEYSGLSIHAFVKGKNLNKYITRFKLLQLPGCCGICISTRVAVFDEFRHKGINTLMNQFRVELAKYSGYGILLCTDLDNNTFERNTLKKNGWKDIYQFTNPRTNNKINITIKELN